MATKRGVQVAGDFSEVGNAMGVISGMAKTVKTDRYLSDVISYVYDSLTREFDLHMDVMVGAAPERFSHVYEWNSKESADRSMDRLWTHKMLGSGGSRVATFVWKASVKPIATPQERKASNPDDPIAQVPDDELAKLSKRRYIFYWKAPIMEYNLSVTITPKYARSLFIPTGDPAQPFVFVDYYRNLQPGGQNNTGQFTMEWATWWATAAPTIFEENLQQGLEDDLRGVVRGIRQGTRKRTGKVGIKAMADYDMAFAHGEDWAQNYVKDRIRKRRKRVER
jgi:hypothetical protein